MVPVAVARPPYAAALPSTRDRRPVDAALRHDVACFVAGDVWRASALTVYVPAERQAARTGSAMSIVAWPVTSRLDRAIRGTSGPTLKCSVCTVAGDRRRVGTDGVDGEVAGDLPDVRFSRALNLTSRRSAGPLAVISNAGCRFS